MICPRAARRQFGYTLIELLIVLGILSVLALLALPLAEMTVQREKEHELRRALVEIRDALDAYRRAVEEGSIGAPAGSVFPYPRSLQDLTRAWPDRRPGRDGMVLRFLRRVPRDPFADPSLPAERSWGLRDYLSEADAAREGLEVYDVHSTSTAVGLNGVPLQRW